MRSGKRQTLGTKACSPAHSTGIPVIRRQFTRIIGIFVCIEHIHNHLSVISQTVFGIINTQEVILQFQLRVDGVRRIRVLGILGTRNRVHKIALIFQCVFSLQHLVITSQRITLLILFENSQVRHLLISNSQQIIGISLVVRISQSKVTDNLNTVTYIIVQHHTGRKTIQLLFDDRTGFMVITTGYTESCLLTTTGNGNEMILAQTDLFHFFHPVRVVVEHLPFREHTLIRNVIEFRNISGRITQTRIEIRFLHQHRILISRQQIHSIRLVGACQTKRISQSRFSTFTTLCFDFNHAIRTLRTPDRRSSSIF